MKHLHHQIYVCSLFFSSPLYPSLQLPTGKTKLKWSAVNGSGKGRRRRRSKRSSKHTNEILQTTFTYRKSTSVPSVCRHSQAQLATRSIPARHNSMWSVHTQAPQLACLSVALHYTLLCPNTEDNSYTSVKLEINCTACKHAEPAPFPSPSFGLVTILGNYDDDLSRIPQS